MSISGGYPQKLFSLQEWQFHLHLSQWRRGKEESRRSVPEIRWWLIETVGKLAKHITVWCDFPEHGRNFIDSFSLGGLHLEHRGHSHLGQSMLVLWYRPSRQEMVIQHSQKRTRGIGTLGSVPLLGWERIIAADDGSVETTTLSDPTRSFLWKKKKKH